MYKRQGLGTPATRAGILETLVRIGFLERKGDKKTKHLIPTHKGTALVTVMPEQIQSPDVYKRQAPTIPKTSAI